MVFRLSFPEGDYETLNCILRKGFQAESKGSGALEERTTEIKEALKNSSRSPLQGCLGRMYMDPWS